MTIHFGAVPANSTLPVFFTSYDSNGASVTLTGLAVTDIEIYKGGSITQRSSDSGYALIDTDGIDIDTTTGLHGFTIDLSDNTDAGFYAVGSFYTVVVSTVTIDTRTVTFIAATFRIVAAEAVTGKPKVDVDAWLGTAAATPTVAGVPEVDVTHWLGTAAATPTVAGVPEVDITHIAGSAVNTSSAQIGVNVVNAAGTAWNSGGITTGSFAAGAINAAAIAADAIGASELAADAIAEIADAVWDEDATGHQTQGTFGQAIGDPAADTNTIYKAVVTDATGATVGVDAAAILADTGTDGVVVASINANAITAAAIATGAIDADALAADAGTEIGTAVWATAARTVTAATNITSTGAAVPITAGGLVSSDVTAISTDTVAADNLEAFTDGTGYAGGTIKLTVDAVAISGDTTAADNAELFFDGTGYNAANSAVGTVAAVTTVNGLAANTVTASALATDAVNEIVDQVWREAIGDHSTVVGSTAEALSSATAPTAAQVADAVWREAIGDHSTVVGSTAEQLAAAGAAGDPWATALPGAYGAGSAGKIVGDNLNATVSSRASQTSLDTLDDYVDTEVAAIKAKTDQLTFSTANRVDSQVFGMEANTLTATAIAANAITAGKIATDAIDADALAADAVTEIQTGLPTAATIADAVWDEARSGHVASGTFGAGVIVQTNEDKTGYRLSATGISDIWTTQLTESYAADGVAFTGAQALFMNWSFLAEKNLNNLTLTTKKIDGSTTSMTFTIDSATTPRTITRTT